MPPLMIFKGGWYYGSVHTRNRVRMYAKRREGVERCICMRWRGENGERGEGRGTRDLGWEGRGGKGDGEEKGRVRVKALINESGETVDAFGITRLPG
jgi:hypothetical protein